MWGDGMSYIIEVDNLTINPLFSDFSLFIPENNFVTISGPNNCGKTTLMRILNKITNCPHSKVIVNNKYLENYSDVEYEKLVQCVIPLDVVFYTNSLQEEISLYNKLDDNTLKSVINSLKIKSLLSKSFYTLTPREIVLSQIFLSIIQKPKILLLDQLDNYISEDEFFNLIFLIKEKLFPKDISIIHTTTNLDYSIYSDYIYLIFQGKVVMEGVSKEILIRDNILNKIGLKVPFMYDLSVKLMDYNLLGDIELDKDRMVDQLWK